MSLFWLQLTSILWSKTFWLPTFFQLSCSAEESKRYKSETTWGWVNHDQSWQVWCSVNNTSVLVGWFLMQSCCILCFCYSVIFSGPYFRVNYSFNLHKSSFCLKSAKELHVTSAWRVSIELFCVIGTYVVLFILWDILGL